MSVSVSNVVNAREIHGQVFQAGTLNVSVTRPPVPGRGLRGLRRSGVREWLAALARQVERSEREQWRRLLGDDTQRINLGYSWIAAPGREAANAGHTGHLFADGERRRDIASYYRDLAPGRLVVTGAAGAGKTVTVVELVLGLLRSRTPGSEEAVPVRMPAAAWDTAVPLADHVTEHLVSSLRWPRRMARALVERELVLPVLDGLDEMDPPLADGRPDPRAPRAREALRVLNAHQSGLAAGPVIVSCRAEAYAALGRGRRPHRLLDAAQLAVAPVPAADAVAYLDSRALDRRRWQPLYEHLAAEPIGPLARLLSTPWRLCLVATAYAQEGDPLELTRHTTAAGLDRHLLARYVPAAVALHPHRRHRPDAVHRRLHVLAASLATPDEDGARRAVIALHELWRFPDPAVVTSARMAAVRGAYVAGPVLGLVVPFSVLDRLLMVVHTLVGLATAGSFIVRGPALGLDVRPRTLRAAALLRAPWNRRIGMAVLPAAAVAVGANLALGGPSWFSWAVLLSSLPNLFLVSFATIPGNVLPPRRLIRDDLLFSAVGGLFYGAAVGFALGRFEPWPYAVGTGLMAAGYMSFGSLGGAGQRYLTFVYCSRRVLPLRLGAFLDWATAAGLLRLSGPAYQFRHRELQEWLAAHPEPPPAGAPPAPPTGAAAPA